MSRTAKVWGSACVERGVEVRRQWVIRMADNLAGIECSAIISFYRSFSSVALANNRVKTAEKHCQRGKAATIVNLFVLFLPG